MKKYLVIITLTVFLAVTSAYSHGAPEESCAFLDPFKGHGNSTAKGIAPFELIFSPAVYIRGQKHTLLLRARDGEQFKGFLIEARAMRVKNGTVPVGRFGGDDTTHVVCTHYPTGNGITQASGLEKDSQKLTWYAPGDVGEIYFYFTVVRGHSGVVTDPADYFRAIRSHPLPPGGPPRPSS